MLVEVQSDGKDGMPCPRSQRRRVSTSCSERRLGILSAQPLEKRGSAWCMILCAHLRYSLRLFRLSLSRSTHLRIQLIHSANGLLNIPPLNGSSDGHSVLDAGQVHLWSQPRLKREAGCSILVPFDYQIVHHEAIQVTRRARRRREGERRWCQHICARATSWWWLAAIRRQMYSCCILTGSRRDSHNCDIEIHPERVKEP